ncbi:YcgL domain-containing protein [Nitrincola alkalilacustris]|uniref:YcgL domain-containing protein n=1 Tax=Nitrincola alkalilacustris TaxID=1571224 RepID=UPI00124E6CAF|nr:YcgL domain-containing protein [Nitrincola alkalilacustris]
MLICSIYKSSRKDEMYLYVDKNDKLSRVPESLLEMFGKAIHIMDMPLTGKRQLARVELDKVLEGVREKGYYLQMPPPREEYMLDLYRNRPESGVR